MATRTHTSHVRHERYGGAAGRRFPDGSEDRSERWVDTHDAGEPDDLARTDDAPAIDIVVERLSRDMTDAVEHAQADGGAGHGSYAKEIIREDTAPPGAPPSLPTRRARLSFFAVAVWLGVAGAILSFIVPPAGLVCFVMAGLAAVLAAILGPGEVRSERTADST
jgi:hypothetical protein